MATLLTEDPEFELEVLRTVFSDQGLFLGCHDALKPEYLSDASSQMIWSLARDYYTSYRSIPNRTVLRDQVLVAYSTSNDREKRQRTTLLDHVDVVTRLPEASSAYIASRLSQFLQGKALQLAVVDTLDELQAGKIDGQILERFKEALQAGTKKTDPGSLMIGNTEDMVLRETDPRWRPAVPTGLVHFDSELGGGLRDGELGMLMAPPKGFKCLGPNVPVIMYNGRTCLSRDVKTGDVLMGDDFTPRKVLETGSGRGRMYRVTQKHGITYEVTAEHVLCVSDKVGRILEITAEQYTSKDSRFHHKWRGYKAQYGKVFGKRTQIKVEEIGDGGWYGWKTDGNHRYLLGDFTVTHNSGTMLNFAYNGVKRGVGVNVLYVTLELSEHLQLLRFGIRTTMKTKYDMLRNPTGFISYWKVRVKNICQPGKNIVIKYFDAYKFTPRVLDEYLEMMQREHGITFGLVVIDYLNLVGSDAKKEKDYLEKVIIATDLRALGHKWKFPLWTAARSNREEQSSARPGMKHMAAAFEWVGICDYCYAMRRYKKDGTLHLIPIASRNEGGNHRIICRCDPAYMYLSSIGLEEMPDDEEEDEKSAGKKRKRGGDDDEEGVEETAREIRLARKKQKTG